MPAQHGARPNQQLHPQGHQTDNAILALHSLNEFRPDLEAPATERPNILLIDLAALYGEGPMRADAART